jgi:hypothetical protein
LCANIGNGLAGVGGGRRRGENFHSTGFVLGRTARFGSLNVDGLAVNGIPLERHSGISIGQSGSVRIGSCTCASSETFWGFPRS